MPKWLTLLPVLGILAIAGYYFSINKPTQTITSTPQPSVQSTKTPEAVNIKANFAIFTNGTFRIFTDSRYHNLSADVFISPEKPNAVQVKRSGITWGDFFKTLPMELREDCLITGTKQTFCNSGNSTLKFYINGEKVDNFLDREIKNGDKALISFGSENEEQIKKQLERVGD